jgi:hypothetical protein
MVPYGEKRKSYEPTHELINISVACAVLAQVLPCPQLIFPSKTSFNGIYLHFQRQKSLQNQYLPHSE